MAYTALYRKFRPQTFESVIGQEHIVRTLKNQMKTGRVSHAYLFCGTRGTGKTSTAKIFARAINCTNPTADGEPCNECAVCKDILAGRSVNVIEIDAASNNGVDNIREIREEVKYPPTQGKYKVYIIDEVHMLSAAAFNALLKTLEEPPAHVIFILATTDPQKVPATILSRVQRFDFRRITTETIAQTLMGYLKEEGQQATPEAVRYVAHLGDGSMRDSLSILDQCLAFFSGEEVTLEKVLDIMGAVDQTIFFEMTDALAKRDAKEAMLLVEQMMQDGRDVKQFVTELLQHLRNLLMAATLPDVTRILDLSAEDGERLKKAAGVLSPEELIYFIGKFSDLQSEMKWATNERILLEVELMKLCAPWTEKDLTALAARLGELERTTANNHCLDRGKDGLFRTIETLRAAGLMQTGTYLSEEERDAPCIMTAGGITFGFVAMTESVNSYDARLGGDSLAVGRVSQRERIQGEIKACRSAGAEVVIAFPHWGEQYMDKPVRRQREYAQSLADWGADAVIGSHPHCAEPFEWITAEDGRRVPVAYSMSNFISNMAGQNTEYGLFLRLDVKKDESGVSIEMSYLPTACVIQDTGGRRLHQPIPCWAEEAKRTGVEPLSEGELKKTQRAFDHVVKICDLEDAKLIEWTEEYDKQA